ncbi:small RNA degrading nuclease 5-like [Hibiscus syriacus]|uniref:small RNA degrading nuclease 5-like n=1 Tax=Hibiscus syriacus TaxID=106335 RepID=UPI0019242013|nr:small RNA degrading nuclease 5-like [Hibiscus syriacus]
MPLTWFRFKTFKRTIFLLPHHVNVTTLLLDKLAEAAMIVLLTVASHLQTGHDSIEDARAAMDLSLLKIRNGPDFGSPPFFMRRKLLTLLGECGKTSSFIDDISIVKRYASESSHAIPVCSDDEALLKARKEVKNDRVHFVWTQFSELNSYFRKQVEDDFRKLQILY